MSGALSRMKIESLHTPHLALTSCVLQPGAEWKPKPGGWCLLRVELGVGYWLDQRSNVELPRGTVLALSPGTSGNIRASLVSRLQLQYFRVVPDVLTGLVSLDEQSFFEKAAGKHEFASRMLNPGHELSVRFQELANYMGKTDFRTRIQLLDLFTHVYRDLVEAKVEMVHASRIVEARERLRQFLKETLPSDFLTLRFVDLAKRINCTPRHLGRIFQEITGMSFREKQAKIRLVTATELLASTEAKVVDVALQSGFQSLSLFGLMFKKRFGLSPTKWRNKYRSNNRRPLLDRRGERVQAA